MIPEETVEQVREAADIVGIIGEYCRSSARRRFRGPCPFIRHAAKLLLSPPSKRMSTASYATRGDVFKFLTKRLGVTGAVRADCR